MGKHYQNYEKLLIQNHYLSKGVDWCQERLPNRSRNSIIDKAGRLGCAGTRGRKIKDRQWKRYGDVVVLSRAENKIYFCGSIKSQWDSLCLRCGREFVVLGDSLQSGKTQSCRHCNSLEVGDSLEGFWEVLEVLPDLIEDNRGVSIKMLRCRCLYKNCGNIFVTRESSLVGGYTKTCGCLRREKSKERGLKLTGENCNFWKGELCVTPLKLRVRETAKYINWRKLVFKRDNYTCQKCGDSKGGNLNAHHIIPFNLIWKNLNLQTYDEAILCRELQDVNNGITLCKKCHEEFHSIYGTRECTDQDFKIWFLAITSKFAKELSCPK